MVRLADGNEILVASVADGAGSAAQSEYGARLAVQSFQQVFADAARDEPGLGWMDRGFVVQWLTDVQNAMHRMAGLAGGQTKDYACTFIGVVISAEAAVFVQIGDGAIVVSGAGCHDYVFWPQHGEFANSTFFMTMEAAADLIQVERRDGLGLQEIALFSDGLERLILDMRARTVHSPALQPIFGWLAGTEPGVADGPSSILEAYLNSPNVNRRTDDDKTLVMATRAAAPVVADPVVATSPDVAPAAAPDVAASPDVTPAGTALAAASPAGAVAVPSDGAPAVAQSDAASRVTTSSVPAPPDETACGEAAPVEHP